MSIARQILVLAKKKAIFIATAESCTGGMVAAAITDVAGSSAIFDRGFVTYTNAAKIAMLGVAKDTLARHGAVSEEVAHEMALGAQMNSASQLTVSITGIAGPGASEFKPEGRVCFGTCLNKTVKTETVEFGARGRKHVRAAAREHALRLLRDALLSA